MKNYQFRTNWLGHIVLQRLIKYRDQGGGPDYQWQDATTQDLKDYYEQFCHVQATCACQEQRRLFDAGCG